MDHDHPGYAHRDLTPTGLLAHVADHLHHLERKIDTIMADQASIDAAAASIAAAVGVLTTETAELSAAVAGIQAWVDAHPELDLSGLTGNVDALTNATAAIQAAADAAEATVPPTP